MNLQYLRYFQKLAREEHYTRASEELGIAQSSLSHAIRVMEEELGVYLFEKQGRNVVLTEAGKCYAEYVDKALKLLEEGEHKIRDTHKEAETMKIGYISAVHRWLMDHICRYRQDAFANSARFSLYTGRTVHLLEELKREKLDVIFCTDPGKTPDCVAVPVVRQEFVVIVPEGHRLAAKSFVAPGELKDIPLVLHTHDAGTREAADQLLQAAGVVKPVVAEEASDDRGVVSLVAMGMGAAIIMDSEDIHVPGVRVLRLDCAYNYRYISLVYRKNEKRPEVSRFIRKMIMEARKAI